MTIDETYFPGFTQKWIETEPGIVINTLIGGNGKEAVPAGLRGQQQTGRPA